MREILIDTEIGVVTAVILLQQRSSYPSGLAPLVRMYIPYAATESWKCLT